MRLFPPTLLPTVALDIITLAATKSPFLFNASAYFGSTVVSIDGVPAVKYMLAWAKDAPVGYRTLGQRLNTAFARFIWYRYRANSDVGQFSGRGTNPQADYLTFVLQRYAASYSARRTLLVRRPVWVG